MTFAVGAGPGSSGDVIVEVRNVKSNARQLTEWAIPLQYNWLHAADQPEWLLTGSTTIRYRADLAREMGTPQPGATEDLLSDSRCRDDHAAGDARGRAVCRLLRRDARADHDFARSGAASALS
jgi:hypothetical protein